MKVFMNMRGVWVLWLLVIIGGQGAQAADASLLNINFGSGTKTGYAAVGYATNDVWNVIGASALSTTTNLVWANGSNAPVSIVVSNLPYSGNSYYSDAMLNPFIWGYAYDEYYETLPAEVQISGLSSNVYDFYFYALTSAPDYETMGFSLQIGTNTFSTVSTRIEYDSGIAFGPLEEGLQFVAFRNVTVPAGETVRVVLHVGYMSYYINGLQVMLRGDSPLTLPNPVMSPSTGTTYTEPVTVHISNPWVWASERYSLDGGGNWITNKSLVLESNATIVAQSFRSGYNSSGYVTNSYTVTLPTAVSPGVTPSGAEYAEAKIISLYGAMTGASYRYSTNGGSSWVTNTSLRVTTNTTLLAQTLKYGYQPSAIVTNEYQINTNQTVFRGALINVNFGSGTKSGFSAIGVTTNDYWNLVGASASTTSFTNPITTLKWADTNTAVVSMVTSNLTTASSNFHSDPMLGSYLYGSYIDGDYNGLGADVKINNLPSGTYTLYVYILGQYHDYSEWQDSSEHGGVSILTSTSTNSVKYANPDYVTIDGETALTENLQYVRFTNVTVTAGTTLTFKLETYGYSYLLNGIQIYNSSGSYGGTGNNVPVASGQSVSVEEDVAKGITLAGTDADGQTLTYEVVGSPSHGSLSGTAPNVTYTPGANYNGSDSFTFRVSDGLTNSTNATVSITVNSVNDAPAFTLSGNVTVSEDFSGSQTVTVTAGSVPADETGQTVTYSLSPSSVGFANVSINTSSGLVTITAVTNGHGAQVFTVTANDGQSTNNTYGQTFTLTVNGVNDVPVATGQSVSTDEDVTKAITLAGTDADGDTLSYTVVSSPTHGTLTGTAPGVTYHPATNYNGGDSFTFRVNDGTTNSATATVSITVNAVNDPPEFGISTNYVFYVLGQTNIVNVTATPVTPPADESGQTVIYSISPTNLTFAVLTVNTNTGQVAVQPITNEFGSQEIVVIANDQQASFNTYTQRFTVYITASNNVPVATGQSVSVEEDVAKGITLAGTDADGQTLTYEVVGSPGHGSLSGTAPNVTYTPGANYNGSDSFTFRVSDGLTNSTNATVSITVNSVNDAPAFTLSGNVTVSEDFSGSQTVTVTAGSVPADETGQTVAYSLSPSSVGFANVSINTSSGLVTITAVTNGHGTQVFTVTANDGQSTNNTYGQTFTLTVNGVNDVPVATGQSVSTDEDVTKAITLAGTDADGDTLSYTVVSVPTHGTLTGTAPGVTYHPATNYNGGDSFTFRVNDGTTNSTTATVSITVNAVNDPPRFTTSTNSLVLAINFTNTAQVVVSAGTVPDDETGQTVTYSLSPSSVSFANVSFNSADGLVTITPVTDGQGAQTFTITANDGQATNNTYAQTFLLSVGSNNKPPIVFAGFDKMVFLPDSVPFNEGTVTDDGKLTNNLIQIWWSRDLGVGDLTYEVGFNHAILTNVPAWSTENILLSTNGTVPQGWLTFETPGTNIMRLSAFDGEFLIYSEFKVIVMPSNGIPAVSVQTNHSVPWTNQLALIGYAEDDGQPWGTLTTEWKQIDGPARAVIANKAITNTTAQVWMAGLYEFKLTATDGAKTNSKTLKITLLPANSPPVPANQGITMYEDVPQSITLTATDAESDTLTFSIVNQPSKGILTGTPPNVTYTPNTNFFGSDSFTFSAHDGNQQALTLGRISLNILAVNDPSYFHLSGNIIETQRFSGVRTVTVIPHTPPMDEQFETVRYSISPSNCAFANISFNITNGTTSVTSTRFGNGSQTFTVTANDGKATNNLYNQTFLLEVNGPGAGDLLNVKFGSTNKTGYAGTGVSDLDMWNRIGVPTTVLSNYLHFDGTTVTPVLVYGASSNLTWAGGSQTPITVAVTNLTDLGANTVNDPLLKQYLGVGRYIVYDTDSESGSSVILSPDPSIGLHHVPAGNYDLYLYAYAYTGFGNENQTYRLWVNGTNWGTKSISVEGVVTNFTDGINYVVFTNLAVGTNSTFVIEPLGSDNSYHYLNGLQLRNPSIIVNQAPVVDVGLDQNAIFGETVFLNGYYTDDGQPTGEDVEITWEQVSGPGEVTFSNNHEASTYAIFSQLGSYTLRMKVFDGDLEAWDEIVVTVQAVPNKAPIVNAGADRVVNVGETVYLNGSAVDDGLPHGAVWSIGWSLASGSYSQMALTNSGSYNATASFSTNGVFKMKLTVNDSEASGSDYVTILVNNLVQSGVTNIAPTVSITSPTNLHVYTGWENIPLQATATDSDDSIASVSFYYDDELLVTLTNSPYAFTWMDAPQGTHVLTARAQDSRGGLAISSPVLVKVKPYYDLTLIPFEAKSLNSGGIVSGFDAVNNRIKHWRPYTAWGTNGYVQTLTISSMSGTNIGPTFRFNTNLDLAASGGYLSSDDHLWRSLPLMLKYSAEGYTPFGQAVNGAADYYDSYYVVALNDNRVSAINRITNSWGLPSSRAFVFAHDEGGAYDDIIASRTEIPTFAFNNPVGGYAFNDVQAADINNSGLVVGRSAALDTNHTGHMYYNYMPYWRAFLYKPGVGTINLGTLDDPDDRDFEHYSEAFAINNNGVVIGVSRTTNNTYHPFYWKPSTNNAATGQMYDMGVQIFGFTGLQALNNDTNPIIVGARGYSFDTSGHAFAFREDRGTVNLNLLVPEEIERPHFFSAWDVNDNGQILANGVTGSSYLLTPRAFSPINVQITSIDRAAVYHLPTNVYFSVSATTTNASITNVDYFVGGELLAAVSSGDFSYTWTNAQPGRYQVFARAYDNAGKTGDSDTVIVMVYPPNSTPIVDAGDDRVTNVPNPITLQGSSFDDGLPEGRGVSYGWQIVSGTSGGITLGATNQANLQITPVTAGTYVLRLTVSDSELSDHDDVTVTVYPYNTPPTVTITNLAGATNSASPAEIWALQSVTLTAAAGDSDGYVTQVKFYADGKLIGSSSNTNDFSFIWENIAARSSNYVVRAVALDNGGATNSSAAVYVKVKPRYLVQDLGQSVGYAINRQGQVTATGAEGAFRYDPSVPNGGSGSFLLLQPLGGDATSVYGSKAYALNDRGEMAGNSGWSWNVTHNTGAPAAWDNEGYARNLGSYLRAEQKFDYQTDFRALGINNSGVIVGNMRDGMGDIFNDLTYAFYTEDFGLTKYSFKPLNDEWVFMYSYHGYLASTANAVNEAGQVVGYRMGARDGISNSMSHEEFLGYLFSRPYVWSKGQGYTMLPMTTLPDDYGVAEATAISQAGDVAGWVQSAVTSQPVPFIWVPSSVNGTNGAFQLLTLPTNTLTAWAHGITRVGTNLVVVGEVGYGSGAYVWDSSNGVRSLGVLVETNGAARALTSAVGVNEFGQIVANGYGTGEVLHAFVLTPVPEHPEVLPSVVVTNGSTNGIVLVGTNLAVGATVTAGTGAVSRVEFFVDLVPVGVVTNSPYVLTVSNLQAGARSLAARVIAVDGYRSVTNASMVQVIYPLTNLPPVVSAGSDQTILLTEGITLHGRVSDDGLPDTNHLQVQWSQVWGPGRVSFSSPTNAVTAVSFNLIGEYRLRLTATDGQASAFDEVSMVVYAGGVFQQTGQYALRTNGVASGMIYAGELDPSVYWTTNAGVSWTNAVVPTNFVFFSGEYARIPGTRWVSTVDNAAVGDGTSVRYRAEFELAGTAENTALLLQVRGDDGLVAYLNGKRIGELYAGQKAENISGAVPRFAVVGAENFYYGTNVGVWTVVKPWTNNNPMASIVTWTNWEAGANEVLWTNAHQPWPRLMEWSALLPGTNAVPTAGSMRWTNSVPFTNMTPYVSTVTFTNWIPSRQVFDGVGTVTETNLQTATLVVPGRNVLEFVVTNVTGLSALNFKADVFAGEGVTNAFPPLVEITNPVDGTLTNSPFTFHLTARAIPALTNGSITEVKFYLWDGGYLWDSADQYLPELGEATQDEEDPTLWHMDWLYQPAGTYKIVARAKDNRGVVCVSQMNTITVEDRPIPANAAFRVDLINPPAGGTYVVPTNIMLQATAASTNTTVTSVKFYVDGHLVGSVSDGPTYKYKWAQVPSGTHYVSAVAFDDEGNAIGAVPHRITVKHNIELGEFTSSATDLTIPLAGLPLSLTRTYDTRTITSEPGDFGIGWQLDGTAVKLVKSRNLSQGWRLTPDKFGSDSIAESSEHLITITVPGGGSSYFYPVVTPTNASFAMRFKPVDGSNSKLEPTIDGVPFVPLLDFDGDVPDEGAQGILGVLTHNSAPFNPSEFVMTTAEGKKVSFSATGDLRYIQDRYGNRVSWNYTNITWSNTNHVYIKRLVLDRDELGRITEVYDPLAQDSSGEVLEDALPVLRYRYDTNGHLSEIHKLAIRTLATSYETNRYLYMNTSFPHHITHVYNADDVLAVQNVYDNKGRLYLEIDAEGNSRRHTYDEVHGTYTLRDRMNNETVRTYNNLGKLVSIRDASGRVASMGYDDAGRIQNKTEPDGTKSGISYDQNGRPQAMTNALNEVSTVSYNNFSEPKIIPPSGVAPDNEYDNSGNLIRTTDAVGVVKRFSYNNLGNQVIAINAYGTALQQTNLSAYNAYGWLTNSMDALGNVTRYTYDSNGNRLTEEKPTAVYGLLVNRQFYDAQNRVVQSINPLNHTNRTVLNKLGLQVASYDALNHTSYSFYDRLGRLTNSVAPNGLGPVSEYDAEGRRTREINQSGHITEYYYDELGRLLQTVYPDGATNTTVYGVNGKVLATLDSRGTWTLLGYDVMGRKTSVTNVLDVLGQVGGVVSRYGYDANGNQNAFTNAYDRPIIKEYDVLNRPTNTIYADGTHKQTKYDLLGQKCEEVDQAGVRTQFGYDLLSRLIAVTNAVGTTNQMVTTYGYDELGYQTNQVDAAGHQTKYEYDALGRRTKRILPGGEYETYAYDAVGNLTNKIDFKSKATSYTYDVMNRLLSRIPDSSFGEPTVTFTYTALGQRASMTDVSGTTYYYYNSRGWLTNKMIAWAGTSYTNSLGYTYDPAGNVLSTVSSSANGLRATNTFDVSSRLKTVMTPNTGTASNYFDAVGNLANVRYANGVVHSYHYDALNRLTNMFVDKGMTTLASYEYKLGPTGNRTNVTELSGRSVNYAYDYLYRLKVETVSSDTNSINGAVGYTFDAVGNRLSRTSTLSGVLATNHTYSSNDWLSSDTYDANGNTTSSAKGTDVYDSMDRLINRNSGGVVIAYNGDGQRVKKTVGGVTTYYLVDEKNLTGYAQVVEELQVVSGSLTPIRVYTYGLDLLNQDQLISGSWVLSWYGYDGHGNVRFLTDEDGFVTDAYDYDAFGNLINQLAVGGTPTPNLYRYTGEQWDPDLGFYYLRARYSSPETGRFWNRDTYEGDNQDPLTLHKYMYCHGSPVCNLDPSGNSIGLSLALGSLIGIDAQGIKGKSDAAKGSWAKAAIDYILGNFWADFMIAYYAMSMQEAMTFSRAMETLERKEDKKNRVIVYNYSILPDREKMGLPMETWVTNRGDLSWDRAISITYLNSPQKIYVYRITIEPTLLHPDPAGFILWGNVLQFRLSVPVGSDKVDLSRVMVNPNASSYSGGGPYDY